MKIRLPVILSIVALNMLCLMVYHLLNPAPKIAVVRSALLIEKYKGFDDVNKFLTQKKQQYQIELDSLKKNINSQEQAQWLYQKANGYDDQFQEETEKLNQSVLEKINRFTEAYAKQQGYQIVLGATLSGNVLHADPSYDITEALLKALNEAYDKGQ